MSVDDVWFRLGSLCYRIKDEVSQDIQIEATFDQYKTLETNTVPNWMRLIFIFLEAKQVESIFPFFFFFNSAPPSKRDWSEIKKSWWWQKFEDLERCKVRYKVSSSRKYSISRSISMLRNQGVIICIRG